MPRRKSGPVVSLLVLLVPGACSGNGSSTPAAQIPSLAVVSVEPADGAQLVEPRSAVTVTFAELVSGVTLDQFRVEDGSGPLAGVLSAGVDGRIWRWTPFRDLPRGGVIRVRLAADLAAGSGNLLATEKVTTFRVREAALTEEWLGEADATGPTCMAWPDGRRAVVNGLQVHDLELATTTSQLLPLLGVPVAFAQDGVGGHATLARQGYSGFVLEVARGELGAAALTSTIAGPVSTFGRADLVSSSRGDLAVYWYGLLPGQAVEGLWYAPPGSLAWSPLSLPAAGEYPLRRIAIDGVGNVFVATVDVLTARLSLQRIALSSGLQQAFDVGPSPDSFWLAAAGNGDALVVWRETETVAGVQQQVQRLRRYRRGVGLDAPIELRRGTGWSERAVVFGDLGAGVVVVREPVGLLDEKLFLQRIEVGGAIGASELLYQGPMLPESTVGIAPRGEAWFAYVDAQAEGDAVMLVRSRPGAALDAPREVHRSPAAALRIRDLGVAIDDSGRGVIALVEDRETLSSGLIALRVD